MWSRFLAAAIPCLAALLYACSAADDDVGMGLSEIRPRPAAPLESSPETAAPLNLPVALIRQELSREVQFLLGDGYADGADFDGSLPRQRVIVEGTTAGFFPAWLPGSSADKLAYAVYRFNLPGYSGTPVELDITWSSPPDSGNLFVGMADFADQRWQWSSASGGDNINWPDFADYISPTDSCLLAVLLTGSDVSVLQSIQLVTAQDLSAELVADVTEGSRPLAVSFDASGSNDPDSSIISYEWDFDGDGTFSGSAEEIAAGGNPQPDAYVYSENGEYDASVRVSSADGGQDTASIQISVSNQLPVAILQSDITQGQNPIEVNLDASASNDPDGMIVNYEWDFDGDGIFSEAGDEETEQGNTQPAGRQFLEPGDYLVALRVTDNEGAQDEASLQITSQGWTGRTIPTAGSPLSTRIASIGGHPAICWLDTGTGYLHYAYSSTPEGLAAEDWTVVVADDRFGSGQASSLLEVDGRPAIAHANADTEKLYYQRANTATGNTSNSWLFGSNITVADVGSEGWKGLHMALISGNPAIASYDSNTFSLMYRRSSTASGDINSDWNGGVVKLVEQGSVSVEIGQDCSLAEIDGRPAIAYRWDDHSPGVKFFYTVAGSADGGDVDDFSEKIFLGFVNVRHISLASVAGNPAILYQDVSTQDLYYRRAATTDGALVTDWSDPGSCSLLLNSTGYVGYYAGLVVINGNPAVVHREDGGSEGTVHFRRSSTPTGTLIGDWNSGIDDPVGTGSGAYGNDVSLAQVDGRPCIAMRAGDGIGVWYATHY